MNTPQLTPEQAADVIVKLFPLVRTFHRDKVLEVILQVLPQPVKSDISGYLKQRREQTEERISAERMSRNDFKLSVELSARAELDAIECFIANNPTQDWLEKDSTKETSLEQLTDGLQSLTSKEELDKRISEVFEELDYSSTGEKFRIFDLIHTIADPLVAENSALKSEVDYWKSNTDWESQARLNQIKLGNCMKERDDLRQKLEQAEKATAEMRDACIKSVPNACDQVSATAKEHRRPCVLFKPLLSRDGNMWCALLGDNLQEGVAAFGETPEKAMIAFDLAFLNETIPMLK